MKKNLFKNKIQMVSYLVIFFLLIGCFVYLGNKNFKKELATDNEKFDNDFSQVDTNNVFKYVNNSDTRLLINSGNAIVFFGTKDSKWVDHYAKILNETAKACGISQINYYDFISDRNSANGTYESIVELLKDYAITNDSGKKEIYAPTLVIIKNHKVAYFDDETSFIIGDNTPENYWDENKIETKKNKLTEAFLNYLGE